MKTTVILPKLIPIQEIFDEFGRITGERLVLMLSYIYTVGFWRYNIKDANFQVSKDVLARLGGDTIFKCPKKTPHREGVDKEEGRKMYLVLLDHAIDKKWIVRDSSYKVGEYSKSVRYLNRTELFQHYQEYTLTSKNSIKALNKLIEINRQTFAEKSISHKKIQESVLQLTFDDKTAFEWVMALPDGVKKNNLFICLYHLRTSREIWKTDKNGRVYTWPVVMPNELRRFITWNGQTLWQLDVTHCHPLLHTILYPAWTETGNDEWKQEVIAEKRKYQALCEQGLLYDFLNDKLTNKYPIADPDMKRLFKNEVFQQVFYGHPESKTVKTGAIAMAFAATFPFLWGELEALKNPNHKELSSIMMKLETEIFVEGVVQRCLKKPGTFPLVTIHDCIMTTEDGIATVRQAIEEEFKEIQMNPTIKEKKA